MIKIAITLVPFLTVLLNISLLIIVPSLLFIDYFSAFFSNDRSILLKAAGSVHDVISLRL